MAGLPEQSTTNLLVQTTEIYYISIPKPRSLKSKFVAESLPSEGLSPSFGTLLAIFGILIAALFHVTASLHNVLPVGICQFLFIRTYLLFIRTLAILD